MEWGGAYVGMLMWRKIREILATPFPFPYLLANPGGLRYRAAGRIRVEWGGADFGLLMRREIRDIREIREMKGERYKEEESKKKWE